MALEAAAGSGRWDGSGLRPSLRATGRFLARRPITLAFLVLLLGSAVVLRLVVPGDADAVADWASTNVHNLAHHPIGAMLSSAFVVPSDLASELVVVAVGFAVLEEAVGVRRTLLIALVGQVVPTLVTEYGAWLFAHWNLISAFSAQRSDVGVSYVMYAVLAAAMASLRMPGRVIGTVGVAACLITAFVQDRDMTTTGHVLSVFCGVATLLAVRWWDRRRRRPGAHPARG